MKTHLIILLILLMLFIQLTTNKILYLRIKVAEMISILNINEKKLIKMSFFEGKIHKTISQELEIPLGTVKSRIRNILKKMKNS